MPICARVLRLAACEHCYEVCAASAFVWRPEPSQHGNNPDTAPLSQRLSGESTPVSYQT
eukprot:m.475212 g.475212  ORF g.475212 m.475212 type:complete len:59 (-) comp37921_c0_seq1:63-239(-)